MIPQAPAGRFGTRRASRLALLPILALVLVPAPEARAADEDTGQGVDWLRDWIPSIALTGGVASRTVFGSIGGGVSDVQTNPNTGQIQGVVEHGIRTTTTDSITTTCIRGDDSRNPPVGSGNPNNAALCEFFDQSTNELDGFSIGGSGQLLGPALNPLPLRPRLMFQGGYLLPQSTRAIAKSGFKPTDWGAIQGEPKVRLQLKADPKSQWWVGGGVALQLPIRRYRTWLKLSAGYSEEVIDLVARTDAEIPRRGRTEGHETITIKSVVPTLGLEAELARKGPISVSLSADTMISVALQQEQATFPGLLAPQPDPAGGQRQPGPINALFEPEDIHVFGGISIRLNWVGFER